MVEKIEMGFRNPVFHKGINCTVRLGDKWSRRLEVGDEFIVKSNSNLWKMRVDSFKVCEFNKLDAADIECEHDPECRTLESLKNVMKSIYDEFEEGSLVTVIYFTVENGFK